MVNGYEPTWEDDHEDNGHPNSIPACLKCIDRRLELEDFDATVRNDQLRDRIDLIQGNLELLYHAAEKLVAAIGPSKCSQRIRKLADQLESVMGEV